MNGSFSLSRALVEQGHRVFYVTSNLGNREYVEAQGFTYLVVPDDDFKYPFPASWNIKNKIRRRIKNTLNIFTKLDHTYVQAEKWINEAKPDVVLLDHMLIEYAIPFCKKNIPIITINCTLATIDHTRPPVFSEIVPSIKPNPLAGIRTKAAWATIFLDQHYREFRRTFYMIMAFGSREKLTVARLRKYGAKTERTEYGRHLLGPEICMGSRHLDFPVYPGATSQLKLYMGASVEVKRVHEYFDLSFLDKEKKLIYCAMGTNSWAYKYQKNLYRCLFEAMDQLPGYQLILQSEGVGEQTEYKRIPENVLIVTKAPQLTLLEQASLFITHGGAGSTREGAYYGVPMIVFPGWHDQHGNAARVVYHGLGQKASMRTITAKKLLALIDQVVNDQGIRQRSHEMKEKLRNDDNRQPIIQFIESYSSYWHA